MGKNVKINPLTLVKENVGLKQHYWRKMKISLQELGIFSLI